MPDESERPKLHIEGDWKSEVQREKEEAAGGADAAKIHVDADWKAQAQAEKERLSQQEQQRGQGGARGRRDLPEGDFKGLISVLASQAIMGLGAVTDPKSGGVMVDLEGARFAIDLLGVVEEKTKGNLTDEESGELTQVLTELRNRYVQISQLVAQQMAGGGGPTGAGGPQAGPMGGGPKL